ncbi:MAG: hypothetical protein C5B58_06380 [Acidobacteria bacterium]|nr:MAG: hypothetical protein C5B58_06380 [Acidobacteriota bacterium]
MASDAAKPIEMRAARSTYVVFTLLPSVPQFIWIWVAITKPLPPLELVKVFGLFVSYFAFIYFFISRFLVSIVQDAVTYRSLFSGTRTLRLEEIDKAKIKIGEYKRGEGFKPFYRLELIPRADSGKKPIVVNLKVFSLADVRQILAIVDSKIVGQRRLRGADKLQKRK